MRSVRKTFILLIALTAALLQHSHQAMGQVSPAEITKPKAKSAEQTYFEQLKEMNRAISQTQFPFPLVLSRYPGLNPKQQLGSDQRGLEFTEFDGRLILKISANYNAAFSAQALTQNQRANRVLDEAVVPILQLFPKYFSPQADFEGVGLEIAYHARTDKKSYAYEGVETLTVVLNKEDAFKFGGAESDRQAILDDSQVFVNGKPFGLMLGQRDPVTPEEEPAPAKPARAPVRPARPTAVPSSSDVRPPEPAPAAIPPVAESPASEAPRSHATSDSRAMLMAPPPATQANADALQTKLQAQLQALNDEGRAHDYFVDYAPPSFAIFRNQIYLQLTLRNPNVFDPDATSIYKRAARSFDLFLAPRLKSLLEKAPQDPAIAGLDITVLTQFSAKVASSSEAIELICPIGPLRSFADAEITNQTLINQSVVLVNGVRIDLNLQQVE